MQQVRIFKSVIWNLMGYGLPLVAGVYAIPRLIYHMGDARFGLLTIIWAIIGYFSFLDFGIGRAITYSVSRALGLGDEKRVRSIYWTGSLSLLAIGIVLGIIIGFLIPLLLMKFMKIPIEFKEEFSTTISWVGFSIPILTLTAAPKGMLESYNKFSILNLLRIPFGVFMFVVPLLFLSKIKNLSWVTIELVVLRLVWLVFHFIAVNLCCSIPKGETRFSIQALRELVRFSGWITVTNFIAPIVNIVDRFFISIMISAAVVVYYTTPFEMINRLSLIPSALATVLFPVLGKQLIDNPLEAKKLYIKSKNILWFIIFIISLFIVTFGNLLMEVWINKTFAVNSKHVVTFITAGIFINGLAYLPYTYMQGSGRPKQVALLHIVEILLFIPLLTLFVYYWGITGASIAWFIRALIDFLSLEYMANIKLKSGLQTPDIIRSGISLLLIIGIPTIPNIWGRSVALISILLYLYKYFRSNHHLWELRSMNANG